MPEGEVSIVVPQELLSVTEDEHAVPPQQLGNLLDEWHLNDIQNRGRPVSFSELLMAEDWDLSHDAWAEGFRAEVVSRPIVITMRRGGPRAASGVSADDRVAAFLNGVDGV